MIFEKFDAIRSLHGEHHKGIGYSCSGDHEKLANFTLKDGSDFAFDQTDVNERVVELQEEYDALAWSRNRVVDYPRFAEQLDLLWHAIDDGTVEFSSNMFPTLIIFNK